MSSAHAQILNHFSSNLMTINYHNRSCFLLFDSESYFFGVLKDEIFNSIRPAASWKFLSYELTFPLLNKPNRGLKVPIWFRV